MGLVVVIVALLIMFWLSVRLLDLIKILVVLAFPLYYLGSKLVSN
jgi:hypothetical protein